ncbi:DUF362 domain-containing protein [Salinadaptatus halalkaliphilus]|uniref:DUF362 domain-containing protein n=1 Tax=Salinadaptatus halalkaliphilus TaxID=2419781 RepID=A0A4S3TI64_9EURY|nr:DUF362 domain-containing protein [Salinadaptatus halalkaliphilus]THE63210.1 DUF362 domain-containing protein [Salinadaptatus halalkaliphilus]
MQQVHESDRIVSAETIRNVCGDRELPALGTIEQVWETDPISSDDIESRAAAAVDTLDLEDVPAGGEIAIGVGSRGINNLPAIVRGTVEGVRDRGYEPFLFPAMGSHGGATREGQLEVLEALDVTESNVDCEIRATMDVELIGHTPDRDVPVYVDANAYAADAIVPVNRIKPHTMFAGDVESGLSKMLVIGMGKQEGAKMAHEWALDWSFRNMIPEIAGRLVDQLPVAGGVAIVEDERDHTAIIEGVPASGFLDREAELLETAYDRMPQLPFDDLDVVVFDRQGKEISGAGMDTNVTGRILPFNEPSPENPFIRRIYTRSLTDASHGNATGVGQADFIHEDLLADLDIEKTVVNTVTSGSVENARIPATVDSDWAGIVACLSTVGIREPDTVRMLRATDTMHLERLYASEALLEEARERDDLRVVAEAEPVELEDGDLTAPSPTPPE